jgi:hypothetical protein
MSALIASTKSTDLTVSRLAIFARSETMSEIPKADRANGHGGRSPRVERVRSATQA